MLGRAVRNLVVGVVWAGALTCLALGAVGWGSMLVVVGIVQLLLVRRGRTGLLFGASSKPTTTDHHRSRLTPEAGTGP